MPHLSTLWRIQMRVVHSFHFYIFPCSAHWAVARALTFLNQSTFNYQLSTKILNSSFIMYITLSKLRFYAYHGVMAQESLVGHYFLVSIKIGCNFSNALISDKVKDTINYGKVFDIVKSEMEIPSKLMEHLAGRIVKSIFSMFEMADSISLSIMKENPPINADCDGCGVELSVSRGEWSCYFK